MEFVSIAWFLVFSILSLACFLGFVRLISRGRSEFGIILDTGFSVKRAWNADIDKPTQVTNPLITEGTNAEAVDGKFVMRQTTTITSDTI